MAVILLLWVFGCGCRNTSRVSGDRSLNPITICDLFKDLPSYQDKMVAVRGIYFHGLRQTGCAAEFTGGGRKWPTILDLGDSNYLVTGEQPADFQTDRASWDKLDRIAVREGELGHRAEIWVTVIGQIRGPQRYIRPGVKGGVGGYGHLGTLPALLVVERVVNVEVKPVPTFDYREMLPSGRPL